VKSKTNGPTAKSFNLNFARLYDQLDSVRTRPSSVWTGDEEAREVVEQLIGDAGYDAVYGGPIENARIQEDFLQILVAIANDIGQCFYRYAPPDEL
jgi:predicted dinucleotide-binding enzyme